MKKYRPKEFEKRWQEDWEKSGIYKAQKDDRKPKKYILDMFPYPSGDGLHVGHFKGYVATDILSRFYRAKGFNVLHPMGWDAFGLPAENYAIKTGVHPKITTANNIKKIKFQMKAVGLSYDWEREINTTDPSYYKWTQWIFIKLFEAGLAYEDEAPINWCPKDKTGLANEEVVNGRCERCGTEVERKKIRQWILKITDYADKLLEGLNKLDWPEAIKEMQTNWIGRSEGARISFDIENKAYDINVFTTRVDTIFGATALILAPEHEEVEDLITNEYKEVVKTYLAAAKKKSDLERTELNKEKTGVFTGSYAINPANGQRIPIWVADYVLGFYGTGAVMLVPAHDDRDFEFATKFDLKIQKVIEVVNNKNLPTSEYGVLVNSNKYNGLTSDEAKKLITKDLKDAGKADFQIQYKLRDWIFSRQRYWGEPIPIIHCNSCGLVAVPEDQLPVELPEVEKYEPTGTGESPLANIPEWVNTKCPNCGKDAKRETNTMPQWAGSCWYYLRFCDPRSNTKLISKDIERYFLPVDWYVGGAEHAVLHLLYSRFWHKFLFNIGVLTSDEPFQKLTNVGLILSSDGRKMSKSLGNVVSPESIIEEYGADTLRGYEAFMGPFGSSISWDPTSINGVYKFLTKVWEIILTEAEDKGISSEIEIALNKLIKKVEDDIQQMKFNTAIAALMTFVNLVYHQKFSLEQKKVFLKLLSPFAPHMAEELWNQIGEKESVHTQSWPEIDETLLDSVESNIVVQVNGKVRDVILASADMLNNKNEIESMALNSPKVQKFINGKTPKKLIYITGKVLSIIV